LKNPQILNKIQTQIKKTIQNGFILQQLTDFLEPQFNFCKNDLYIFKE